MSTLETHKVTPSVISDLVMNHVLSNEKRNPRADAIFSALHILLNGDYVKYSFDEALFSKEWGDKLCSDDFQTTLSKIDEKTSERKSRGKYYTPKDVTKYVLANSFVNYLDEANTKVYSAGDCMQRVSNLDRGTLASFLFDTDIFDPTAGAGEFLLSVLEMKYELAKSLFTDLEDGYCLEILSSIYGNDIEIGSVEISKIRLFFFVLPLLKRDESIAKVANILNQNFTCKDFVIPPGKSSKKFDIIVGNPPYVEYSNTTSVPTYGYGNIYADILHNSSLLLKKGGVMGFVVPLSYSSTSRMSKLRSILIKNAPKQFVLNYADRPDSLFVSVHQKLTILLAANGLTRETYSSGYTYWYKSERKELLNGRTVIRNDFSPYPIIPKIGNDIELSIFSKVVAKDQHNTLSVILSKRRADSNVFLNMRGCFWIKAFSFNPGSSEYKGFFVDEMKRGYVLSILNSSLFFLFWIIMSDCWHITNKELSFFQLKTGGVDYNLFESLFGSLERKLEQTKSYIGTKQSDYAYKHKECKAEIDLIDNALRDIYGLTDEELNYVKQFALKYRMSNG